MTDQKISRKNTFFEDNDEGDKRTDSVSRNYSKPRAGTKGLFDVNNSTVISHNYNYCQNN